jgi:hypothetical protein
VRAAFGDAHDAGERFCALLSGGVELDTDGDGGINGLSWADP